ncbi:MAG: hypothetical protein CMI58_03025 [Parcubacteria group bacterium]|nr:hypothetical protein [Parcubacteria group bacterium]
MPDLVIDNLTKYYDQFKAVDNINLKVSDGELITLLGPSGCGKTTTLRLIAGLEKPDKGKILLGDEILSCSETGKHKAPEKRGMGMVFQSYAVWPHMTVAKNVAYPLKNQKISKIEKK